MFIDMTGFDHAVTVDRHVCPIHVRFPGRRDAPQCTCRASYTLRVEPPKPRRGDHTAN